MRKGDKVKQQYILILILFFATKNVFADLNDLIRRNINSSSKSYEQIVDKQSPRLWVHVRNQEQEKFIQDLNATNWFESIKLNDTPINFRPIQLVDNGPKLTQLRYFFKQDKDEAELLLKQLLKIIPQIQLKDFSNQYGTILVRGHYELWLAPNVTKLSLP